MNEIIETKEISKKIYEIRGVQVMLDSDLAKLYQCTNGTKDINKAVNRNLERFPENFYFQLTKEEEKNLRFQNGTLKLKQGQYSKYLPHVFTEEGVAMLSAVLKTKVASKVSVDIMNAFVAMRKYISSNLLDQNKLLINHENRISLLENIFDGFNSNKNDIYNSGQIYDAYSKIVNIFKEAKSELIIIDAYADKVVLDIISKLKVSVILVVKTKSLLTKLDIEKYNKQYSNLKIIYNDTCHDRYFIIDRKKAYHCGISINHAGEKLFGINLLDDNIVKDNLINQLKKIIS